MSATLNAADFHFSQLSPRNPDPFLIEVDRLRNAGRWDLLVKRTREEQRRNAANYNAWLYCGLALHKLKKYDHAINCFDRAVALNPNNWQGYHARGCSLRNMGQGDPGLLDEAISDYQAAKKMSREPVIYADCAVAFRLAQEYSLAINDYTVAIAADNENAEYFYGRSRAYMREGLIEKQLADLNRAVFLEPSNPVYQNDLTICSKLYHDTMFSDSDSGGESAGGVPADRRRGGAPGLRKQYDSVDNLERSQASRPQSREPPPFGGVGRGDLRAVGGYDDDDDDDNDDNDDDDDDDEAIAAVAAAEAEAAAAAARAAAAAAKAAKAKAAALAAAKKKRLSRSEKKSTAGSTSSVGSAKSSSAGSGARRSSKSQISAVAVAVPGQYGDIDSSAGKAAPAASGTVTDGGRGLGVPVTVLDDGYAMLTTTSISSSSGRTGLLPGTSVPLQYQNLPAAKSTGSYSALPLPDRSLCSDHGDSSSSSNGGGGGNDAESDEGPLVDNEYDYLPDQLRQNFDKNTKAAQSANTQSGTFGSGMSRGAPARAQREDEYDLLPDRAASPAQTDDNDEYDFLPDAPGGNFGGRAPSGAMAALRQMKNMPIIRSGASASGEVGRNDAGAARSAAAAAAEDEYGIMPCAPAFMEAADEDGYGALLPPELLAPTPRSGGDGAPAPKSKKKQGKHGGAKGVPKKSKGIHDGNGGDDDDLALEAARQLDLQQEQLLSRTKGTLRPGGKTAFRELQTGEAPAPAKSSSRSSSKASSRSGSKISKSKGKESAGGSTGSKSSKLKSKKKSKN